MSRNILEFPITQEEAVEVLDNLVDEYLALDEPTIGGQEGYILTKIRDFILNTDQSMIDYIFAD